MKSPTSSVGIIEPDGMRKGSNRKPRKIKTTSKTGKKDFEYSSKSGSEKALPFKSLVLFEEKNKLSISQINPVTTEASNRKNSKS
jgi:hypothetical protein